MSRRPSWRTVSSTRRRSSSVWRTLVGTAIARRPVFANSARASSRASGLRAAIATSAPCSARPSAMERPMPRLPPVTMATLPAREKSATGMSPTKLAALHPGFEILGEARVGVGDPPELRPDVGDEHLLEARADALAEQADRAQGRDHEAAHGAAPAAALLDRLDHLLA